MYMHTYSRVSTLSVLALVLAACSSSGDPAPTPGPTPESPAPSPVPAPVACPPAAGPTTHKAGGVGPSEVWTAAGSPHIVEGDVRVADGAKLVIEPCAEVRLVKGAHILVAFPAAPNSGTLVAEGTAERPIRFVGLDGARWASILVHTPGTARLAHVTLEGGGGGDFEEASTLSGWGDGEDGSDPVVYVDHVTISGSLGTGAWMHRGGAFIEGSRDLTIRGSGNDDAPWPMEIEEHGVSSIPTGRYVGNKKDAILLDPKGGSAAGSGLLEDAVIHARGVPYQVGREKDSRLRIGGRVDGKPVTLTVEAGVEMRFVSGSGINVQTHTSDKPSTAVLRVLGDAARPVVLTSDSATPAPGDWRGIWYGGIPSANNRIEHARIEYAGGYCSCILNTCSAIAQHEAAVIFTAQPPSAFITSTTFRASAGHGITEGFDGSFVDFRPTNTFEGVSGCAQTRPRNVDSSCPSPKPACDG